MTVRVCYGSRVLAILRDCNCGAGNRLAGGAHIAALRFQREGSGAQQRENNIDSEHVSLDAFGCCARVLFPISQCLKPWPNGG